MASALLLIRCPELITLLPTESSAAACAVGESRADLSSPSFTSSSTSSSSTTSSSTNVNAVRPISFELMELASFKLSKVVDNNVQVTFILKDGSSKPPMQMKYDDYERLVAVLNTHLKITRPYSNDKLNVVEGPRRESSSSTTVAGNNMDRPSLGDLLSAGGSIASQGSNFVKRFYQDPFTTAMASFSKVTNALGDVVEQVVKADQPMDESQYEVMRAAMSLVRLEEKADQGFEVISFHKIQLPPAFEVQRRAPLTKSEWLEYFDEAGRIARVSQLKESVFRGGVEDDIRRDVWKYLLGYYKYDQTHAERETLRVFQRLRYEKLKAQWRSIEPDQERRWTQMRERKDLVDKDVQRTDRNHAYFASPESAAEQHLSMLNNILMSYCMYNWDLGYVQGMSDLLAPILVVMDDESDAFWCFDGFMNMVHMNFDMEKMKKQLENLGLLLQIIDPNLHQYIQKKDSGQLFFCFRWLLILFKREFCFPDLMRLWEVMWTGLRCRNFQLLIALAILENERSMLIENKFGLNEILKHINDLAMHIDVEKTLKRAEGMYLQLANVPELPDEVRSVLGLPLLFQKPSSASLSDHGSGGSRRGHLNGRSKTPSRSPSPSCQQRPRGGGPPHLRSNRSSSGALNQLNVTRQQQQQQQSGAGSTTAGSKPDGRWAPPTTSTTASARFRRSTDDLEFSHILLT